MIDTNQRLSDLQFSQIIASLSDVSIWNPTKVFQYHHSLTRLRSRLITSRSVPKSVWQSSKLRHWSSTNDSALSIVLGNFHTRFDMRTLCVGIVEQLHQAKVPVLLALGMPQDNGTSAKFSSTDLLKYLLRQALQVKHKLHTEKSMTYTCASFHHASTETEWFQMLEAVLADIGSEVYIVADLGMVEKSLSPIDEFSWVSAFEQFFTALSARGLRTKLKVLLVSYRSLPFRLPDTDSYRLVTLPKMQRIKAWQQKVGKDVSLQQLPLRLKSTRTCPAKKRLGKKHANQL